ncbi:MAG: gluconeogenesis factor YvcK family protein [Dethiobacteria bacterium]
MAESKRKWLAGVVQWLYPGLKIKRWLILAMLGLGLVMLAFTLLIGPEIIYYTGKAVYPLLTELSHAAFNLLLLLLGLLLILVGLHRASKAVGEVLQTRNKRPLIQELFTRRYLAGGPRLVAIGGGTGLSTLLRYLKEYTSNLTAVVTVTDDGGSSGRLRGELGMLPPGDIRSCLLAMADTEPVMERLFQHRFTGGSGLEGHSFGNLFIAAMTEMYGFQEAIRLFGQVLAIRGQVFPVTLNMVQLQAEDTQGRLIRGQSVLYRSRGPLRRISLLPPDCKPLPEVICAIQEADAVVLGPGSLFTSVIPNLLVPGIVEALRRTSAAKIYVCNVMTQPGETTGFTAADHVEALLKHSAPDLLDYVLVNSDLAIPPNKLEPYRQNGAELVRPDFERLHRLAPRVIASPLIDRNMVTHHNGKALARLVVDQVEEFINRRRSRGLRGRLYHFNSSVRRHIAGSKRVSGGSRR